MEAEKDGGALTSENARNQDLIVGRSDKGGKKMQEGCLETFQGGVGKGSAWPRAAPWRQREEEQLVFSATRHGVGDNSGWGG